VKLFGGVLNCGATKPVLRHWLRRQTFPTFRSASPIWFPRHDKILSKSGHLWQAAATLWPANLKKSW
jgi:hypothetical protein